MVTGEWQCPLSSDERGAGGAAPVLAEWPLPEVRGRPAAEWPRGKCKTGPQVILPKVNS